MMRRLIDTHVHTNLSDGLEDVSFVVEEAYRSGISLLSITDHDCVRAYPGALKIAASMGIDMVPGVEITTKSEDGFKCVHIVGLGIETGAAVSSILDNYLDARYRSELGFLENVNRYFAERYPKWEPTEEIKPSTFWAMLNNARRQGIDMTEKEMMDVILNEELWVPIDFEIPLEEAVSYIKEWGGVPVLAHPFDFSNDVNVVWKRFLEAGGEGVEVCKYRYKSRTGVLAGLDETDLLRKERELNLWTIARAKKDGLKLTMASDHHDKSRSMGMMPEEYGIDIKWIDDLKI